MSAYVLVADDDRSRVDVCMDVLTATNAAVRSAATAPEAVSIAEQNGPPSLLVVDLLLRDGGGFAVLDAVNRQVARPIPAIGWARSRAAREFALARMPGGLRILRSPRSGVLREVIDQLLRPDSSAREVVHTAARDVTSTLQPTLAEAARLFGTSGAAVYLRVPGETHFRTVIEWAEDTPIPYTASWMPQIFDAVMATGQPVVSPDLAVRPRSDASVGALVEGIHGIAAVPMTAKGGEVVGMLCVFGVEPLVVINSGIDALAALGRLGAAWDTPSGPRTRDEPAAAMRVVASPTNTPLTALDRGEGIAAIARERARARREHRQLGVIVLDIDAATSAAHIMSTLRATDLVVAWQQNEVVIVLAGVAAGEARRAAERVHAAAQSAAAGAAIAGGVSDWAPHESFEVAFWRAEDKMKLVQASGQSTVT